MTEEADVQDSTAEDCNAKGNKVRHLAAPIPVPPTKSV